jgi:hypothetical protein
MRNAQLVAVPHAELRGVGRVELDRRRALPRVEGEGAACHRPGVPVVHLAPGVEEERELIVGQLRGREELGRDEARLAVRGGEGLVEQEVGPHVRRTGDGIL